MRGPDFQRPSPEHIAVLQRASSASITSMLRRREVHRVGIGERVARRTARVVVLVAAGRVLLFGVHEERVATHPRNRGGRPFLWCTPGGGCRDGESFADAARRELWEETGLRAELGPLVWRRVVDVELFDQPIHADEQYFLVRAEPFEVDLSNMEELERGTYREHRWWSAAEVAASDDLFFPEDLAELLAPLSAGELPAEPVVIPP